MDVRKTFRASFLRCLFGVVISITSSGCGGGGGGDDIGNPPSAQPELVVGGTVSAPNAAVAFHAEPSTLEAVARFFISSAHAALAGATSVPDGTLVELVRIDDSGNSIEVIASTKTSGGRYSLDFQKLGIEFASDLILRVVNESTTAQMRAFATYGVVDIDPISEATFRLILNNDYFVSLKNLSTNELTRITASTQLFARIRNFSVLTDIESTVDGFLDLLSYHYSDFISDAVHSPDETDRGPGGIGTYFPLDIGIEWDIRGDRVRN